MNVNTSEADVFCQHMSVFGAHSLADVGVIIQ